MCIIPKIIGQIKSRTIRWTRHMARMLEETKVYKVLVGKSEGRDVVEVRGVDGMMGPECILERMTGGGVWSGFGWLRIWISGGLL
jgi:hypothetical protein